MAGYAYALIQICATPPSTNNLMQCSCCHLKPGRKPLLPLHPGFPRAPAECHSLSVCAISLVILWRSSAGVGTIPGLTTLTTALERLQICAMPPSTKSSMPLTKLLSSDARKTTALAISSGVPTRPRGILSA